MKRPPSPYLAPGFYDDALARGRHRDIVGGRWDETGRAQMAILLDAGLQPHHHLLDIGAGSLRLGCKAVPFLDPGHYWATDLSRALMLKGHEAELPDPSRLDPSHLVHDPDFSFPGIPASITHAIAFAVFPHLPIKALAQALPRLHASFPALQVLAFTVFLAPAGQQTPFRQADGVVTHSDRPPRHFDTDTVIALASQSGFAATIQTRRLPRGQVLVLAKPDG